MDHLPLHPRTASLLDEIVRRPKGSYLLHGADGSGQREIVPWLARRLNCLGDDQGLCRHCAAIAGGNYPDLWQTAGEEPIKIETVRAMIQALGLAPYYAIGHRLFVLDATYGITPEAQNALLKAFEEPPPRTIILILTTSPNQLLPTVRSRCEPIYFVPPARLAVAEWLISNGSTRAQAERLVELADGRPALAQQLAEDTELEQSYSAAETAAAELLKSSLFDRLVAAKRLAEQKVDIELITKRLARALSTSARQAHPTQSQDVARGLAALDRFQQRLRANVTVKAALESLALELPA